MVQPFLSVFSFFVFLSFSLTIAQNISDSTDTESLASPKLIDLIRMHNPYNVNYKNHIKHQAFNDNEASSNITHQNLNNYLSMKSKSAGKPFTDYR